MSNPRYRPSRAPFYLIGAFVAFLVADIAWYLLAPEQASTYQAYLIPVVVLLGVVTMVTPAVLETGERKAKRAARELADADGSAGVDARDSGQRPDEPTVVLRTVSDQRDSSH